MLESLERANIKRMAVEKQETKLEYDPLDEYLANEKEITAILDDLRSQEEWFDLTYALADIKTINPEFQPSAGDSLAIQSAYEQRHKHLEQISTPVLFECLRTLGIPAELDGRIAKKLLSKLIEQKDWKNFAAAAAAGKLAGATGFYSIVLQEYKQDVLGSYYALKDRTDWSWRSALNFANDIKEIYPEADLELTEGDLINVRKELDWLRGSWYQWLLLAQAVKGLKFGEAHDKEETPQMPEGRNF